MSVLVFVLMCVVGCVVFLVFVDGFGVFEEVWVLVFGEDGVSLCLSVVVYIYCVEGVLVLVLLLVVWYEVIGVEVMIVWLLVGNVMVSVLVVGLVFGIWGIEMDCNVVVVWEVML